MRERRDDELRDWLRSGDPGAGHPGLGESQRSRLRARILEAAREPAPSRHRPWRGLIPIAVAAGLLLVVGSLLPGRERFRGADAEPAYRVADDGTPLFFGEPTPFRGLRPHAELRPRWPLRWEGPTSGAERHIEFTTPGGHRVVWNLDDELRLPDERGSGSSSSRRS